MLAISASTGRLDGERRRLGQQIADLAQERLVGRLVGRPRPVRVVPGVDLGLQRVPPRQQGRVPRGEIVDQGGEPGPEGVGREAGAGERLGLHEIMQDGGHVQAVRVDAVHGSASSVVAPFFPGGGSLSRGERRCNAELIDR